MSSQQGKSGASRASRRGGAFSAETTSILWCFTALAVVVIIGTFIVFVVIARNSHTHTHDTSGDSCACVDAAVDKMCECTLNATSTMQAFITTDASLTNGMIANSFAAVTTSVTNLFAQYFGIGCITITAVPYTIELDYRRYCLGGNFTLSSAMIGAVRIVSRRGVVIDYAGYYMQVNFDGALPVHISNSTDVQVLNQKLVAPTQQVTSTSRGVNIQTNSVRVKIIEPYCENMSYCFLALSGTDVTIVDAYTQQNAPGNGTTPTIAAVFAQDVRSVRIEQGNFNNRMQSQITYDDGLVVGILVVRNPPFADVGQIASVFISGKTYINGFTIGLDLHRGCGGLVEDVFVVAPALGAFGSCGQVAGSAGSFDALQVHRISCNIEGGMFGGDGWLAWNMRASSLSGVSVYGRVDAVEGFYRGSLLGVGLSDYGTAPPGFQFRVEATSIKHVQLKATRNDTVCMHVNAGIQHDKFSMDIEDVITDGGLVGVLLANHSSGIRFSNVHVNNASYGIAAVNHSQAHTLRDVSIFKCCQAMYTDSTTRAIRISGNSEFVQCAAALNVNGINHQIVAATGIPALHEIAVVDQGGANHACVLPDVLTLTPEFTNPPLSANQKRAGGFSDFTEHQLNGARAALERGIAPRGMAVEEVARKLQLKLSERHMGTTLNEQAL